MNRYAFSYRSQLIVVSLIALLALVILLVAQTPSLTSLAIQRPAANDEAASGAADVELPAGIHPADRKFYSGWYEVERSAASNVPSLSEVHPADRKFFSGTYVMGQAATDPLAHVHPADRKFYNGWYAPSMGVTGDAAVPVDIDPADRKFFIRD